MESLLQLKQEFIDKELEEISESYVSKIEWQDFQSSPLGPTIPASLIRDHFKTVFKSVLYDKKDEIRIARGIEIIDQNLARLSNEELCRKDLRECANRLAKNLLQRTEQLEENSKNVRQTEDPLVWAKDPNRKEKEGETIADLLGISFNTCKAFYEIGLMLFKEQQYEDASCVFYFLSLLQPYSYETWVSLGLCHQKLKDWFFAAYCFALANVMNPFKIDPYIYGAECYVSGGDKKNARGNLITAEHFLTPENRSTYEPLIKNLLKHL